MNKVLLIFIFGLLCTAGYSAPLWMRDAKISPDGQKIVFCYMGDIYKVGVTGGKAVQLTTHPAYDSNPVWSPDGKQIAFASDRNGNFDVFVMSSEGGVATRVTTHSASEIPYTFTPDGKEVVYGTQIQDPAQSALFPTGAMTELYKASIAGGRPGQVLATPAEAVCFSGSGETFLYQNRKGFENEWRKHHTSSITRDLFLYDIKSETHQQLTDNPEEDRDPVFSPDGKTIYFLSERGGTFNVYSFSLEAPREAEQLTFFKINPVRFLSIARDGTLCFGYDGEIYIKQGKEKPVKVKVDIVRDADTENVKNMSFSGGATEAVVSPDGKQIALVVRGEVFVTSVDYRTTKQITRTAERESELSFAPDNRSLAYASERGGNWNLYIAKIARPEEVNFPNATLIEEEELLPSDKVDRSAPRFSPDGMELAFIEERSRLMVMNLKTKKVRQITDGSKHYSTNGNIDYSWSPDSKWFTLEFIGNRHDPYGDIGIVSAEGGKEIINITNSGYMNNSPRWVLGGNAILFNSERYGMRNHASWGSLEDVMLVFMNQEAYDKFRLSKEDYDLQKEAEAQQKKNEKVADKKTDGKDKKEDKSEDVKEKAEDKSIVFELAGMEDRIVRLTPNSSNLGAAIIDKDGEKLYYMSAFEGGYDLWVSDLRKSSTRLLHKLNSGWVALEIDKEGKKLFLLGGQGMQKLDLGSEQLSGISFNAEMTMDLAAERVYMFDRVYREELKRFYHKDMHGVDWELMRRTYGKFLPHINNNYDFAEMLSEMLGELNVSHTGASYSPGLGGDVTANLGLLFDLNRRGDGLLIDEVLEKGPFDKSHSKVKAGNIIEAIDGVKITGGMDYFALLNKKANKKTLVSVYNPQNKERWEEVVLPINSQAFSSLLYNRWVKQRAADVERLSGGRLGYVHIQSMGDPSFRSVYSDILGKYNDREGIVIDTRFNGGGRLHEDIEVLFSGEKYFTQVVRGKESCDMPSRRWNKPSVMLTCEANYSNAHGTPWVYKHQKIGKVVGMPVPGTMTSVNWEALQDPSLVFGIPVVGYRLPDGSYLENQQLEPDVKVSNSPEKVVKGEDEQLKAAVEELLKDLDGKK